MFNRNRFVVTVVWILFIAEIAAMCTVLAIAIPQIQFTPQCLITSTPKSFASYWYAPQRSDLRKIRELTTVTA